MNFNNILFESKNHIAKITLNMPKTRNAINPDMREELIRSFSFANDDDSVRVIVITGVGNVFCAGGDLSTLEGLTPIATRIRLKRSQSLIRKMFELEKPIIAAINGTAAGAGVSLALASDIIVASEKAKFSLAFVKVGSIPDMGEFYLLPIRIGVARAKELMLTGDIIDAREAEQIGLINRVVSPPDKLEEEVYSMATRLAKGPGQSYAMIKTALNRWPATLEYFLEIESNMQAVAFSSYDFNEGRKAFLEKREAEFQGK